MPTRNGQFDYPEESWSVGRMAKVGPMRDTGREFRELEGQRKRRETRVSEAEATYPTMNPGDWNKWFKGLPDGSSVYAGKNRKDLNEFLKEAPAGFAVPKDHPGIKGLNRNDVEIFDNPDMEGHLFVRPKKSEPLTSEWEGPTEGPGPQRATG